MKILLVDDSLKHRRSGKSQLEARGHEVVAVSEYGEARELVKEGGFDIALLDLLMPAEATTLGPEARRACRSRDRNRLSPHPFYGGAGR